MIQRTTWKLLEPDTSNGFGVQVINTLTTKDKEEFDDYINFLKENVGDGLTYDWRNMTCAIDIDME